VSAQLKSYVEVLEKMRADNDAHAKLMDRPEGFYEIRKYGRFIGYGFFCPKCKLEVLGVKESSIIKHCGREEQMKTGLGGFLQRMGLKSHTLPG
jgi:hypothetical protein